MSKLEIIKDIIDKETKLNQILSQEGKSFEVIWDGKEYIIYMRINGMDKYASVFNKIIDTYHFLDGMLFLMADRW
jgi:hypothetical protein